jgi:hypothetical protein
MKQTRIVTMHRILWALILALAGCATPYRESVFDPPDASFAGIKQLMAQEPTQALDLFIVHGMCTHDADWAFGWLDRIGVALGGVAQRRPPRMAARVDGIELYSADIALSRGVVRVHAMVWSGLTKPLKDRLCYDQTHKTRSCQTADLPAYPYERARLNALVKDRLLDDCFSDAVIYQGASRQRIVRQVQSALLTARADSVLATRRSGLSLAQAANENDAGMVVLSSSLGSKVVFDAILELAKMVQEQERLAGEKLFDRTRQIFMAANQIPLLALGDDDGSPTTKALLERQESRPGVFGPDPIEALVSRKAQRLRSANVPADAPAVIAFSDPNDLLSYPTRPYFQQIDRPRSYPLIDVIVSNASTLLGLLENPATAHLGYGDNREVLSLLICGRGWARPCQ